MRVRFFRGEEENFQGKMVLEGAHTGILWVE